MDHSIPGPSGNTSEATRIELQPENLDYVDVDDPVQRAVDDVSDEESDDGSTQCTIKMGSDEMRLRLTLLSAFGSATCAREYMSDNARSCGVHRRLMTPIGENAHQEFVFVTLMPFPNISTHKVGFSNTNLLAPRVRLDIIFQQRMG
ncbi:hypothetical protein J6590_057749 [Homalodisca vitripennis]|nr:hypothetical protein J6590_057749 [Homalodisca vitripennis]